MKLKALIVDDEEIIRQLLKTTLGINGFAVTQAADGIEAAAHLRICNYDVVITDLQMGTTDGMDVIRMARESDRKTIIIMITGCYQDRNRHQAFRLGADDFLLKPFSTEDLLQRIDNQLAKRENRPRLSAADKWVHRKCQNSLQV